MNIMTYIAMDFWRNLRNFGNSFFIIVLPTALFLFFGVSTDWNDAMLPNGTGNVSAYTMVGIAVYGAATATTSLAGSAAVELQQGWGRQLALTSMSHGMFIAAKSIIALVMAAFPVVLIYLVGLFTITQMTPGRWFSTAMLTVLASVPFALYGLMIGLAFRSDAAVGAASGALVIFGFLGNNFFPLEGILLEIGRFTPMYGMTALARYPLTDGQIVATGDSGMVGSDPLWILLISITVWSAVFAIGCILLQSRRTARR
ncbi:ABC transporter permease [Nesterenkonia haasae]|uniref:ABC transporter permease n=1 Tax=Nesterenkonia haasae TaxID=2587813 RepID=UPI00139089ED|nr:ABC transporter permease [Nesterenkonia haasae]NDK30909.1 ABC transporter permease [Nesterenkonia haasae]